MEIRTGVTQPGVGAEDVGQAMTEQLEYSTAGSEPLVKPFSGKAGEIGGEIEKLPPYVGA